MMDSQGTNQPLEEGKLEENKNLTEASQQPLPETSEVTNTEAEPAPSIKQPSKTEILNRLKEIAQDAENAQKQEIDSLKQTFYKIHKSEQEAAQKSYIESGGDPTSYVPENDGTESEFKTIMGAIKEKRNAIIAEQEKQKEDNLQAKLEILEKLKALVNNPEEANKAYNDFKKLQQQWNEIKQIPVSKVNELWRNYQLYVEKFYDILKLNNEFRDYDFKKNLEIKTRLCIAAEKLTEEPDPISAFHQLQKLHQEYRDTGPVAKELRDEIWNRFKIASTDVNRRYQQHFEELKESEQRNQDEKTVICEIVESTDYNELNNYTTWENKTREIIALQAKWKEIGRAPQKINSKLFERFRSACDDFFKKKAAYFQGIKEEFTVNLEKKKALCEKAEALKESTDWKETGEILSKLQKEWKTIGPVPKKHIESLWKRFIKACDYFFEQREKATSSQRTIENENLVQKKAIIEKLVQLDENTDTDEAAEIVRNLMKEWNSIGHVPFREKDKLYKQYHALIDKHFERLHLNFTHKKLNNFRNNLTNIGSGDKNSTLYRERDKLMRAYENMKSEIQTYENNLGFLTSSSKKGNNLVTEMNRKVEKLKSDLELISQKIKVIDESLKQE